MTHHCCVPQCSSNSSHESCKHVSFHKFPKDPVKRKKWIIAIRRDTGVNFTINQSTKVCSKHFKSENYLGTYMGNRERARLKFDAVPSVFAWTLSSPKCRRKLIREPLIVPNSKFGKQLGKDSRADEVPLSTDVCLRPTCSNDAETTESTTNLDSSKSSDDSLQEIECEPSPDKNDVVKHNINLLKLRNEEKFTLLRFCGSDTDIKYYTGFPTYKSLNCFYNFLLPEANFLYYVGTENTSKGTPYMLLNKRGPTRTLSPMEELFVTLVRLRKGLPEKMIADLYQLSEGHLSRILNTWISFLYDRLRSLPIWPSKHRVETTMPSIFREHYASTRVIIDCTEIFIEQPSASDCERETFSSYKHHNTAKGLLRISPDGQITFVSSLYAGRCSDKKIVRHCGLLDIIEEGDGVMVDRGFDIKDDLDRRGAKLIIPAFLNGKDQFCDKELASSRSIAVVRVHVERAVRKVK